MELIENWVTHSAIKFYCFSHPISPLPIFRDIGCDWMELIGNKVTHSAIKFNYFSHPIYPLPIFRDIGCNWMELIGNNVTHSAIKFNSFSHPISHSLFSSILMIKWTKLISKGGGIIIKQVEKGTWRVGGVWNTPNFPTSGFQGYIYLAFGGWSWQPISHLEVPTS